MFDTVVGSKMFKNERCQKQCQTSICSHELKEISPEEVSYARQDELAWSEQNLCLHLVTP